MSSPKRTLLPVSAQLALALCIAAIGGFVGFLIGDDSRELRRLRTELDKVESQLVTWRSSSSKHEARRPGFFTSPQTIQTTNTDFDLSREEKQKLLEERQREHEERIRRELAFQISSGTQPAVSMHRKTTTAICPASPPHHQRRHQEEETGRQF